jgi:DNA polymerase III subunit delta
MPPRPNSSKESSPQRVVLAAVQAKAFAPVYYLFGDDDYLKDVAIHDLLAGALDPASRDFNCDVRRASEMDAEAVNDVLGTPPMLAERRAVVIRDAGALKKGARAQLDKYLLNPAPDTLLILTTPAGAKTDAALSDAAEALNFAPLSPERVRKWITHHAETVLHIGIATDAVQLLQQAVGNDLQMLAGELDKCASYMLGRDANATTIDTDAVSAVVGVRRGETVTDLLDAVARHDAATAVKLLSHVLGQPKVTAVGVTIMLTSQAFALAFGRARREAGVPTNRLPAEFFSFLKETGGYPGRPWGEAASAWTREVDGWSTQSCERALERLLEADIALKDTTVSDAEQTMMSLILALCALRSRGKKAA